MAKVKQNNDRSMVYGHTAVCDAQFGFSLFNCFIITKIIIAITKTIATSH